MSAAVPGAIALLGVIAMLSGLLFARRAGERRQTVQPPSSRSLLRRALGRHEIEIHYQPVFHNDGTLAGAEALVRWRHPSSGLIGPGAILNGIDDGLELELLTTHVLADASLALARLRQVIGPVEYLGVNVPAALLELDRFAEVVVAQLRSSEADGGGLVIELTETSEVRDWEAVKKTIRALRPFGIRLALDDFGRGHANLPALGISEADIVKLDKALIDKVLTNERSREIVESIVQLAAQLKMQVVAEGIEDLEVLDWLRSHQISYFQGYVLGCPQPVDELIEGAFRTAPIPALSRLPGNDRGSILIPSAIAIAMILASFGSSLWAIGQWRESRSPERQATVALDRLERSYLDFTSLYWRLATSDTAAGRPVFASTQDDLLAVRGLELLDSIERAGEAFPTSGQLAWLSRDAEQARSQADVGDWTEMTAYVLNTVAPAVRTYLDEEAPPSEALATVDTLDQLLFQRVAILTRRRQEAGFDSMHESAAVSTELPAALSPDPITVLLDGASSPLGEELTDLVASRGAVLLEIWPVLAAPTSGALRAIDADDVLSDSLSVHLAVHREVSAHDLAAWGDRRTLEPPIAEWTWLASGATAPALGLLAAGHTTVEFVRRRRSRTSKTGAAA